MSKGKEKDTGIAADDHLPWVEKYRPKNLDDVYGQSEVVRTVRKFVESNRIPHLLFYGPPGTGKTSTVMALAQEIYGKNYKNMVLELNASDDRGIDVVRNQIKDFASTMQIFSKGFKLIVLDEADAMTNVAQNALRRVIEKYTTHARFCILANYAHKLNPALLSRCTRFRFSPLSTSAIRERVEYVIAQENVIIEPQAVTSLLELSKGDMRKALNVLQACHAAVQGEGKPITDSMIYESVGAPHPEDISAILGSVLNDDWTTAYGTINRMKMLKGMALVDVLTGLFHLLSEYEVKNPKTRIALLKGLSEIEYAISKGGTEKIQTSAAIAVIKSAMELESSA